MAPSDYQPGYDGALWMEGITKGGAAFRFTSRPEDGEQQPAEDNQPVSSDAVEPANGMLAAASAVVRVYWPVTVDNDWKETSQDVKDIGISKYRLGRVLGPGGSYVLEFVNTKGWGFTFIDESGDAYFMSTPLNRCHMMSYNSSKPTIIGVQ